MHSNVVIKRSKKAKQARLSVKDKDTVVLTVPRFCSKSVINEILDKHQDWITATLLSIDECDIIPPSKAIDQTQLSYLGDRFPLSFESGKKNTVTFHTDHVHITHNDKKSPEDVLTKWFIDQARDIIEDRVLHYQELLPKQPTKVSVRSARTRWGSCSGTGSLNFNWKLLCAPLPVIDGVVVHELCHLVHMNHSKAFWDLVYQLYPTYDEVKDWTITHRHLLML